MKKLILIVAVSAFTSLMACDVCTAIDKAQAKVEYTYKMYTLSTDKVSKHKWMIANAKANKQLDLARQLHISHKID